MKSSKKILALVLALAMMLSVSVLFAGCTPAEDPAEPTDTTGQADTDEPAEPDEDDGAADGSEG